MAMPCGLSHDVAGAQAPRPGSATRLPGSGRIRCCGDSSRPPAQVDCRQQQQEQQYQEEAEDARVSVVDSKELEDMRAAMYAELQGLQQQPQQ